MDLGATILFACSQALERAVDGAGVRRIFSSSPLDPRYHMLSFISQKFYRIPPPDEHEPRAALFLNRFTRSCTIMFATASVSRILGPSPDQLVGKSFYFCITENCLRDAVRCLESAKANDSIAYLRFWSRDPLQDDGDVPELPTDETSTSDEENDGGGVSIKSEPSPDERTRLSANSQMGTSAAAQESSTSGGTQTAPSLDNTSRTSSATSPDAEGADAGRQLEQRHLEHPSSTSVTRGEGQQGAMTSMEVEAVVSCTSDGLVVILRRARPLIPHAFDVSETKQYVNGLFASPWAIEPVLPPSLPATIVPKATHPPGAEPEPTGFMKAIREVAVFAWSLTGINGSLAQYARGTPSGEAMHPGGLPIWDPTAKVGPENDQYNGFGSGSHRRIKGDGLTIKKEESSSEDEVLWKRVPHIPPWKRPKRRAHEEAFGGDTEEEKEQGERPSQAQRRRIDQDEP